MFNVADNLDLTDGPVAEDGTAKSYRRLLWEDSIPNGTKVAVWIAEPGIYPYPPRDLEEVFTVIEGEAMCSLGGGDPVRIGPGSVVHVPKGVAPWLHVLTPFRKVATVVPKP